MIEGPKRAFLGEYLLFLFFLVYLLTSPGCLVCDNDQNQVRYEVTKAIVERFDVAVPSMLGVRGVDGRSYSWYGLGQSLLMAPFYVVGKVLGIPELFASLMNPLLGALTGMLVFFFCRSLGYSDRASVLTAGVYAFATFSWPLAKHPFDHTTETFFLLLAVYFTHRYTREMSGVLIVLSALSFGFAVMTRYVAVLALPPMLAVLVVASLRGRQKKDAFKSVMKSILLFLTVLLPFAAASLWYNHLRFGSFFETGFSLIAERTGVDFFTGTPLLTGLKGFLISPGKGFFFYSPVALLFFFTIRRFFAEHGMLAFCFLAIIMSYLLFLSRNIFWHGDWSWGPRYLLAVTPFFVIPIARLFDSAWWSRKKAMKGAIVAIIVLSVLVQVVAVSVDFKKHLLDLRFHEGIDFVVLHAKGVPLIVEPPDGVHFDWRRSPLLSQPRYVLTIARGMRDYRYASVPENATVKEKMKADPFLNLPDFWWVHRYYANGGYRAFVVAVLLLLFAAHCAARVRRLVSEGSAPERGSSGDSPV